MDIDIEIVNAFVDGGTGGNPAGVVLDADQLTHAQKLAVAQRVGLSETAFVSASAISTFKLEFYTPTRQIAHCGHATIAAFCRMRELGRIDDGTLSKETIDGTREIVIRGEMTYMQQRAPTYTAIEAGSALDRKVMDSIRVDRSSLIAGMDPMVVNTGNSFLVLPVRDAKTLASLRPNLSLVAQISDEIDLVGYYAFAGQTQRPRRDAATRMFAPRYGIDEEAATGMAAGPLACYLRDKAHVDAEEFHIEQGWFMHPASPSVIQVNLDLEDGAIKGLMAGGTARSMSSVRVTV